MIRHKKKQNGEKRNPPKQLYLTIVSKKTHIKIYVFVNTEFFAHHHPFVPARIRYFGALGSRKT